MDGDTALCQHVHSLVRRLSCMSQHMHRLCERYCVNALPARGVGRANPLAGAAQSVFGAGVFLVHADIPIRHRCPHIATPTRFTGDNGPGYL